METKKRGKEETDESRKKTEKVKIKTGAKNGISTGENEPASTQSYFHRIGQM